MAFEGFYPETFDFLINIAFNNNKEYFKEHKDLYNSFVKSPLIELEQGLQEMILKVDPRIRVGKGAISRIYKDTRFSKDKLPFRDHAWIGYKPPETCTSEFFGIYFEITPVSYGYGMGSYGASTQFMKQFREKAIKNQQLFLSLISEKNLNCNFVLNGEDYKKTPTFDCDERLLPYLNKKRFYLHHNSQDKNAACTSCLFNEVQAGFNMLIPLYKFIHSLP